MGVSARAIFLTEDKHVLVQIRNTSGKPNATRSQLQFPGGMVDANESPRQAVIREVKEELGVDLEEEHLTEYYRCACRESGHDLIFFKVDPSVMNWISIENKEPEKFDHVEFIALKDVENFALEVDAHLFYTCSWVINKLIDDHNLLAA